MLSPQGDPEPGAAAALAAGNPEPTGTAGRAVSLLSLDTLPGSPPGPERDRSHQK